MLNLREGTRASLEPRRVLIFAIKNIWTTKNAFLSLFTRPVKITATFDVATLCAAGDTQCKTTEGIASRYGHAELNS